MDRPKVYKGLPDEFINKIFWPDRDYRTNPLSHIRGGSDLIIEYTNGKIVGYDWIKFPDRYCLVILNSAIKDIFKLDDNMRIEKIRDSISNIYARKYTEEEYDTKEFELAWENKATTELPWISLLPYSFHRYPAGLKSNYILVAISQGWLNTKV